MEKSDQRISRIQRVRRVVWIDGEPIEFEWNVFPGFAKIEILGESCRCSTTLIGHRMENSSHCFVNSKEVRDYAEKETTHKDFSEGIGHSSVLEEKWFGTYSHKPEEKCDNQANETIKHFAHSGHAMFRGTSALNR